VLTAVMHLQRLATVLITAEEGAESGIPKAQDQPNPLEFNMNELMWSGGSFLVFAILFRYALYPRLRKSMDARYAGIRAAHDQADAARQAARADVADYEAQLASVKAEAAARVEAARQTLEAERSQQVAALDARLEARRSDAAREAEAARAAVRDQIRSAVAEVAAKAGELATGRRAEANVVDRAVNEVMAR